MFDLLSLFRRKPEPKPEDTFEALEAYCVTMKGLGIYAAADVALYRVLCKARGVEPKA